MSDMRQTVEGEGPLGTEEVPVQLSELAAEKVREFKERDGMPEAALRVSVLPGGCSGFEYGLNLDEQLRDDDLVFESHGVRVAVDPFSLQYLSGVHIDYESSFQGSGFTFRNPNATGSCGCGTSFAV